MPKLDDNSVVLLISYFGMIDVENVADRIKKQNPNFTGGVDLGAIEVYEAAEIVREAADIDANIIFGAVIDETLNDEIRLTVIATGFEDDSDKSVLSTPEQKVEHKIETTVKSKEEVNTEKIDPLLDLDRESVNIPSFLRSRK